MAEGQSEHRCSTAWISLGLIGLNFAIYAPVLTYDFVVFDDSEYVTENPYIAGGLSLRALKWAWTTGYQANWHPLTWISHIVDIQLFGFNPGEHHAINLALHILSTLLLFAVLSRMTGTLGRSLFVAALFAAHPLHVQSVAWVAERKDVLSTVFWMLTLWCYAYYVQQPGRVRYGMVVFCLGLGLLAKPMLVTIPFVLLLLDVWPLRRVKIEAGQRAIWMQLVSEKLPLLGLAAASSTITFLVQSRGGAVQNLRRFPLNQRLGNAAITYTAYGIKMFWPARLAVFYPFPHSLPAWKVLASVAALTAISAGVWSAARRFPYLLVGWCWYLGTLVPVIGLVQVGGQAMADRYSYIPLIGLFIIVAWGGRDLSLHHGPRYFLVAAVLAVASCAALARAQLGYWNNFHSLWTHTLEVTEDNEFAENFLGYQLVLRGDLEEGKEHLSRALRINPGYVGAHTNLGIALFTQNRLDEALVHFWEAVRLAPQDANVHSNLGLALVQALRREEAIVQFSDAIRLAPNFAEAHNHLAGVLIDVGRREAAIREVFEALRIDPGNREAHRLAGKLDLRALPPTTIPTPYGTGLEGDPQNAPPWYQTSKSGAHPACPAGYGHRARTEDAVMG